MPIKRTVSEIVEEMQRTLAQVPPEGLERLVEAVLSADRLYVAGGGRSGLMARAFAMRLMQLGLVTYVVGETTTPAIRAGDLLLACSASGETQVTVTVSEVAKKAGGPGLRHHDDPGFADGPAGRRDDRHPRAVEADSARHGRLQPVRGVAFRAGPADPFGRHQF